MTFAFSEFYRSLMMSAEQKKRMSDPAAFSGTRIRALVAKLEAALLAGDAQAICDCAEQLVSLLERQVERFEDDDFVPRMLSGRAAVLRSVASRMEHAVRRAPPVLPKLAHGFEAQPSLLSRILAVIPLFADHAQVLMGERGLSPNIWFMMPKDLTAARKHLGVACFHITRVVQHLDPAQAAPLASARDEIFEQNFDLLFYAMTYGPLTDEARDPHLADMLRRHFDQVEGFFTQDQPSIFQEPEKYMLSKEQVVHSMTTMNRVRETLERLSV